MIDFYMIDIDGEYGNQWYEFRLANFGSKSDHIGALQHIDFQSLVVL